MTAACMLQLATCFFLHVSLCMACMHVPPCMDGCAWTCPCMACMDGCACMCICAWPALMGLMHNLSTCVCPLASVQLHVASTVHVGHFHHVGQDTCVQAVMAASVWLGLKFTWHFTPWNRLWLRQGWQSAFFEHVELQRLLLLCDAWTTFV